MIQANRAHATPILSIRLLGNFGLYYEEQPLSTINTARLQALLAYLVLYRDTPVSRQHVAFLFWPDSSEAQARTNLRNLLYKLRSALPSADQFLSIDQYTIQWQTSAPFTLDVDEFRSLSSHSSSIQDLKTSIQIYAGDFMPDCYEDWAQTIREGLRHMYLTTLENLIVLLGENKGLQEALHYGQILLQHEPTREATYRQLMYLYARRGDRASVARIYKTCATVLGQELGIDPSPATNQAYENFIAQASDWASTSEPTQGLLPKEQAPHNLPPFLTTFIGREQELEQIKTLLAKHHLVTLSGPGGIGKTRLALAVAKEMLSNYGDGVFVADLAPLTDAGMLTTAIAEALQTSDEVQAAGLDGLVKHLRDQDILLLLDNCEHLTKEVGTIVLTLLQACPDLRILTTSREVLNVYGETVYQVPPLPLPVMRKYTSAESAIVHAQMLHTNESVALFVERAVSTLPTFRPHAEALLVIGEICRRLEGMPLAIEMAAARVKTLAVHQIVQRLDNVLDLLKLSSSSALPHHRTMEAVMDWSFAMLTTAERNLFARLSVFSGDFSLQAAEKICQGEGIQEGQVLELLASLVDKSLVETLPMHPEARFRLHEIARQYAHQKLNAQEPLLYWQNRHIDYFVRLAEEAESHLRTADQLEWLSRLELEQENLRVALRLRLEKHATSDPQYIDFAARLVGALWLFWFIRGQFNEGRHWAERALASLEQRLPTSANLGKVLYVAASFCYFQGDLSKAEVLSEKSLRVCRVHKDIFGEVISFHHLAMVAMSVRDLAKAAKYLNRGLKLAIQLKNAWLTTLMREDLAELAVVSGDFGEALQQYQQSLEIAREVGDKFSTIYCLTNLARLALRHNDLKQADMFVEESLSLSRLIGERRGISFALHLLGRIALGQKELQRAGELLKESLHVIWSTRDRDSVIEYLVSLADYEVQEERFEIAARILAACEATLTGFPTGYRLPNQALFDQLVEAIQARLDKGIFTTVWTLGRLMSLEQAVSFALIDRSSDASSFANK